MSFTPAFTITQNIDTPNTITIEDTSTGAADGIVTRRIYLQKADGTYLVEDGTTTDYEVWLYSGGDTIDLDVMGGLDYALSVRIDWLNGSNVVLYTDTETFCFTAYSETFDYGLTEDMAGNPNIVRDPQYFANKSKLRVYIDAAEKAVQYGDDIYSSQRCLDAVKDMIDNQNLYF